MKREIALSHISTVTNEIISLENGYKELEKEKKKAIQWIRDIFSARKLKKLPSELIHSLIAKVIVHGNHNFEIIFRFDIDNFEGGAKVE